MSADGEQRAVVARTFDDGRAASASFFHFDVVAGEFVFGVVEHAVRGFVQADQRETRAEDAKRDLVEAQITHGLALLPVPQTHGKSSIRAHAREAFLHFGAGAATVEIPAK